MDSTLKLVLCLIILSYALLFIILYIAWRLRCLKRQIADMRIKMVINQREELLRHQLLIEQIKQHNKPTALDDLQHLFADKVNYIKRQYPALTDIDIQVLTLIGLGVDNADILQFTDMSKRTYYKRRQLIAQRINTTAAQLDETAKQLFSPKMK